VTYDASLAWLDSTQHFGIRLGLETTQRLAEALGSPQATGKFLHVAGTNGKGSVCAMLDAILRGGGYRTGLYTSPHLIDFSERIVVDGRTISPSDIAAGLTRIRAVADDLSLSPTYFEVATLLALDWFAKAGCDYVVLETGLGGRLDATNIVTPIVSILTPIGMDHCEWLGRSLDLIALEKAGIIKAGCPVVSSPQEPEVARVYTHRAEELHSSIDFVSSSYSGRVGLIGHHQLWNAALAILALQKAQIAIADDVIASALSGATLPARFQCVTEKFVVDGSHNPPAAEVLVRTWRDHFGEQKACIFFGAMRDKDHGAMLEILAPIASEFVFLPIANERACDPKLLAAPAGIPTRVAQSLNDEVAKALASDSLSLFTGSLFLAGEVLSSRRLAI